MTIQPRFDRLMVALGACLVAATIAVLIFAGPSDNSTAGAGGAQKAVAADRIVISDFKFVPETVEVEAGTKLTFINEDAAPHTATDTATEAFDTGILRKGERKAVTLTKASSFAYICELHAFMKATIKVVG